MRPSKSMLAQIRAVEPGVTPDTTTHKFTPQQAAIIGQHVQAVNQAQIGLNIVFVGIMLGRDIDPAVVNCALDPADVTQFITQAKAP